ncbi:MAG: HAMP domain-containing sensor histidine kinase [Candidatus Paceibacterota bacterium]|jgi:signal transduction histidine kinase
MNTLSCTGAADYGPIIYYSHLVPVFIILILSVFTLTKTKSTLSRIFITFSAAFSLWLLGDLVTWVANDNQYDLISLAWAPLDYLNIIFFVVGAYFFIVLVKERDMSFGKKLLLFLPLLPAWWLTFTNQSVTGFDQTYCENYNNDFLAKYKLTVEALSVFIIAFVAATSLKKATPIKRRQIMVIASALILFFSVFAITEYISSATGNYSITLYSLFILPIFLFMIMYSITDLEVFQFRLAGSQLLVYTLMVLTGSQFFFVRNNVNRILTAFSFLISLGFGFLLIRDSKRENEQKLKIERLNQELLVTNERLKEVDKQKTEFISFASHQLRGPLTSIRGYASIILEGDLGELTKELRNAVDVIFKSAESLVSIVGDYLDVSRIELGKMKYEFKSFDLRNLAKTVITEFEPNVKKTGLTLDFVDKDGESLVYADENKIKQVISNIIDNSMKYTKTGGITVAFEPSAEKVRISIKDTGVGIPAEILPKLFEKFARAPDASKTNILGTGLGLFVAKKMMEAHRGRIWAESEGKDKGSTFFIELDKSHKMASEVNAKLESAVKKFNDEIDPAK